MRVIYQEDSDTAAQEHWKECKAKSTRSEMVTLHENNRVRLEKEVDASIYKLTGR